jgi:hypothetical protein
LLRKCHRQYNVALLNIVPLGTIICGVNTQDCSAISRYFSHQTLTQVVQYLARQPYKRADIWFAKSANTAHLEQHAALLPFVPRLDGKGTFAPRQCQARSLHLSILLQRLDAVRLGESHCSLQTEQGLARTVCKRSMQTWLAT